MFSYRSFALLSAILALSLRDSAAFSSQSQQQVAASLRTTATPTFLRVSAWVPPDLKELAEEHEEREPASANFEAVQHPSSSSPRISLQGNRLQTDSGTVLLEGLGSHWTADAAATTTSDNNSGVFLHTDVTSLNQEITLGELTSCHRFVACARVCRYWMGPTFGTAASDLPYDTQFMLVETAPNGPYAVILPLVDGGFRASLQQSDDNDDDNDDTGKNKLLQVVCAAENGQTNANGHMRAVYVQVGDDPFTLLQSAFAQVAQALGTFTPLSDKELPPNVDEFGWCTWDAFYSKVDPKGILEGVASLRAAGVPPKTLILDDGWQQVSPTPPVWAADTANNKNNNNPLVTAVKDVLFGWLASVVTVFYDVFVKRAPHGSMANTIWRWMTRTILKGQLWNYFDAETDFHRQLDDFDANHKFESSSSSDDNNDEISLKTLVSELKNELGLARVFCWHAIHGYWRGVSRGLGNRAGIGVEKVFPKPSRHMLRMEPQLAWDTVALYGVGLVSTEEDVKKFYNHIHAPLVEAGIDGVKVDVQSGVSAVGEGVESGPELARIYTEGMEASVSEKFTSDTGGVNCINCMCHSTENLYRYQKTAVARASDDFFPEKPDSHTIHLYNVAYNSLFIGEICLPDWDMFHSKHESAALHAAARAVGGCPVYVSDKPGHHDTNLLKKLVLPDGSVLRAQLPGRPTRDSLFVDVARDGTSPLKVWNQNHHGGVVAAFNIQGVAWNFDIHDNEVIHQTVPAVSAQVKARDIESLRSIQGPFCAFSHQSKSLTLLENGDASVDATLEGKEWEIFTIVPLQTSDTVRWAPIGLGDMLNGGGAVLQASSLERTVTATGVRTTTAEVVSRGPGRFVAYAQPAPSRVLRGDDQTGAVTELAFDYDGQELSFELPNESSEGVPHQLTIVWDE